MHKQLWILSLVSLFVGCGLNPFGPGAQGGLDLFANMAKHSERPKVINEKENGKEGANGLVKEGAAATGRLAKRSAIDSPWILERGLRISGDTLIYHEIVRNKPSEEDAEKFMTGTGEVKFGYSGTLPTSLDLVDTTLITDVYAFHFVGRENKSWKRAGDTSQVDSVNVEVNFSSTTLADIKPGLTRFWAKNISSRTDLGKGDTAAFALDSLDDSKHTQYGRGDFLDSLSGRGNDEGSRPFHFDIQILHKNSLGGNPYLRYEDNEGIVSFKLPWGASQDSLYFSIHFLPNYQRQGTIRKNGPEGPVLVEFEHNEKTGLGWVLYRNENGEEIGYEKT